MSLPPSLLETYKQYKTHTDRSVRWLLETARRLGYDRQQLGNAPSIENDKQVLATDLEPLAQYVSDQWPKRLLLREHILVVLRKAIDKRTSCHEWHTNNFQLQNESHEGRDATHAFFICQLSKVRDILHKLYDSQASRRFHTGQERIRKKRGLKGSQKASKQPNLGNAIGSSDKIDDTNENEEIPVPVNYINPRVKDAIAEDPTDKYVAQRICGEDTIFAVDAWLKLKREVHEEIKEIWTRFKKGKIALSVAATTTDVAIGLLQEEEMNVAESLHQHTCRYDQTVLPYLRAAAKWIAHQQRPAEVPTAVLDRPTLELLHDTMVPTYGCIKECNLIIAKARRPGLESNVAFNIESIPWDDPLSFDAGKLSFVQEEHVRRMIIEPLICRTSMLVHNLTATTFGNYYLDGFAKGVKELTQTGLIPAWFVFAAEIQFDIHLILGPQVDSGFRELNKTRDTILKSVAAHQAFLQSQVQSEHPTGMPVECHVARLEWAKEHFTFIDDIEDRSASNDKDRNFNLLDHQPVWCGVLQFCMLSSIQASAIGLERDSRVLIYLIYFYDAIKNLHDDVEPWADVDHLIDGHGIRKIFFGSRPDSIQSYEKKNLLVNGISLATGRPVQSKKFRRSLTTGFLPLFSLLFYKYFDDTSLSRLKGDGRRIAFESVDRVLKITADGQFDDKRLRLDNEGDFDFSSLKNLPYSKSSAAELLRGFQNEGMRELPYLLFDYLPMLQRAHSVFEDVFHTCKYYIDPHFRSSASPPLWRHTMSTWILGTWARYDRAFPRRKNDSRRANDLVVVRLAKDAVRRAITREGDVGVRTIQKTEPSLFTWNAILLQDVRKPFVGPTPPEACRPWKLVCEIRNLQKKDRKEWLPVESEAMNSILPPLYLINNDSVDASTFWWKWKEMERRTVDDVQIVSAKARKCAEVVRESIDPDQFEKDVRAQMNRLRF